MSKQPLQSTTFRLRTGRDEREARARRRISTWRSRPSRTACARRGSLSSAESAGDRGVPVDGCTQLLERDGGGPPLHHDQPRGIVRQPGRVLGPRAAGERGGEGRDDRIARAGDVGYLAGPEYGDVDRGAP